jgi:hypothetical protein
VPKTVPIEVRVSDVGPVANVLVAATRVTEEFCARLTPEERAHLPEHLRTYLGLLLEALQALRN